MSESIIDGIICYTFEVCDRCDYKVAPNHNLNFHMNMKHEGIPDICDLRDFVITMTSNLILHMKNYKGAHYILYI